jgi:lysophospholipase L1-like esterase
MRALQDYLRAHASPVFALPAAATAPPRIFWAGPVTDGVTPPSTLPAGTRYAASSPLIGGAIRERLTALAGAPLVGGMPCLAVSRPYTCKGQTRNANARPSLRIKTDAPVIELSGILPDGAGSVQSLIVDGRLVPSSVLSASRGRGGWTNGTIVIDFGTQATRDMRIDTGLILAYIKIDQQYTLFTVDDLSEPQISVIGDSYQQARSVTFATDGAIAQEIGARLGIGKVVTDAIGGTGYYNSGGDRGNLNDRLPAHASDNSIVYVVMAGLNDYGDYTGTPVRLDLPSRAVYEQSVHDYLRNLRLARPQALIVVTAPFCPIPPQSDSTYVTSTLTNTSGLGDFTYIARLHKEAIRAIEGPWVHVDVLMGGGWLNSSGATGDVTGLQWFTGGTPGPGTSPTYKPGNTRGGGGGGFGGIARVPIVSGGVYTQGPEIIASGGSGQGFLATSIIDSGGRLTEVRIVQPGHGYTDGAGLPQIHIDAMYETTPAVLGTPELIQGINPNGAYPLPSFAPPGATDLNNVYRFLSQDQTHPSPLGVEYISKRLAQNIYQAVMAL